MSWIMTLLPSWFISFVLALTIVITFERLMEWRRERQKLPPGPLGLPFIGSLFWLGFSPHVSLTKMIQTYGDVITITFGSYTSIVLNSIESVRETLVKHSYVYAGRPQLYSFTEVRGGLGILFIDFTPKYQRQRKLTVRSLHRTFYQSNQLETMLACESKKLVEEFAKYQHKPFDPKTFLRLLAANVILKSFFDNDFAFNDDTPRDVVDHVEEFTSSTNPVNLSDIIPCLQRVPIISNNNKMKAMFEDFIAMHRSLYDKTVPTRQPGSPRNVTDALLDNMHLYNKGVSDEDEKITEEDLVYILADLVGAAFETIANTLCWALLYLAANPEWQTAVQSELDATVGRSRLPDLHDRDKLPMVQATLYEVLRIGCVLPLTLPHSTIERTQLRDYDIPKGTFVFVNLWAIHHDPKHWHMPYKFNPRRFLDENDNVISKESFLPFSTGSRSCLGKRLADDEIFVFFAVILQQFRLHLESKNVDFNGEFRLTLAPKPYQLTVEKRF